MISYRATVSKKLGIGARGDEIAFTKGAPTLTTDAKNCCRHDIRPSIQMNAPTLVDSTTCIVTLGSFQEKISVILRAAQRLGLHGRPRADELAVADAACAAK